ncbi:MAG: hypothetical protein EOP83_12400 [Verrucomicrobiaceae bacterium]|nr:MAG: hypothetical protein EOP83_12400 [Verrucomicrobiaceae bacterium]
MRVDGLKRATDLPDIMIPADLALAAVMSKDPLSSLATNLALDHRIPGAEGQRHAVAVLIAAGEEPHEADRRVQDIIRSSWEDA